MKVKINIYIWVCNKWPSIQYKFWYLLFFETTIMGNTADLAMVQKTTMTPSTERVSHRGSLLKGVAVQEVLYQSILNAKLTGRKKLGMKMCTSNRDDASLRILSSKADSNTWESFTRSELKLEPVHQESPRSDNFRKKRATKPLLNIRSILPGLRKKKRIGLLLRGPKASFRRSNLDTSLLSCGICGHTALSCLPWIMSWVNCFRQLFEVISQQTSTVIKQLKTIHVLPCIQATISNRCSSALG